jgi:DNA-directed RNA polymerase specialized sigma24 family protein
MKRRGRWVREQSASASEPPTHAQAPQRELEDNVDRLAFAIECLPSIERLVLNLRHHDELTFAEIGAVLGMSAPQATGVYARGRAALGRLLRTHAQAHESGPRHD